MATPIAETICFTDDALGWEEAVRRAGRPLVDAGLAEESYLDAMVETVRTMGAYIVLAPHVAVPHARPEAGALGSGISILRTRTPVSFADVDEETGPVELFFALVAVDKEAHLELLRDLALLLGDEENIDAMLAADGPDALRRTITDITRN